MWRRPLRAAEHGVTRRGRIRPPIVQGRRIRAVAAGTGRRRQLSPGGAAPRAAKIVRDRRRLGLTQADLAHRAGIRPESLNRIELGYVAPKMGTVEKIDRVLREAEKSGA